MNMDVCAKCGAKIDDSTIERYRRVTGKVDGFPIYCLGCLSAAIPMAFAQSLEKAVRQATSNGGKVVDKQEDSRNPDVAQVSAALADAAHAGGLSDGYYRKANDALDGLELLVKRQDKRIAQLDDELLRMKAMRNEMTERAMSAEKSLRDSPNLADRCNEMTERCDKLHNTCALLLEKLTAERLRRSRETARVDSLLKSLAKHAGNGWQDQVDAWLYAAGKAAANVRPEDFVRVAAPAESEGGKHE